MAIKPTIPLIVFECTQNCNLDCKYCYNIWKRPNHNKAIEYQQTKAKDTLKTLYKQVNVDNVTFTGGEPFMCNEISELVLFARLKKSEVNIITNGTVAKVTDYAFLKKIGVDVFELPYHSFDPDIHNLLVNNTEAHQKVTASIKALQKLKATVIINIVITKLNVSQIEKTLIELKSLGVKDIMLNRYNIGGNGLKYENEILPLHQDLQNAYAIANTFAEDKEMYLTANVCTPYCILNPTDYPNIQFAGCSDNPFDKPITLEVNGNIRLCNHSPIVIGNINQSNIFDVLNENKEKIKNKTTPAYCSDCTYYHECNGGCIGSSLQLENGKKYDAIIDKYSLKR